MPYIREGQSQTFSLAAGDYLVVTAKDGSTANVALPLGFAGGPLATVTNTSTTFGPARAAATATVSSVGGEVVASSSPDTLNSIMRDGTFEQTTVQDLMWVFSQGGTYSTRTSKNDGTSLVTATDQVRSGARSLKFTRGNVGTSYVQILRMALPVQGFAGSTLFFDFWARSTLASVTPISLYQCAMDDLDSDRIPQWQRRVAYATNFSNISIPADWTTRIIGAQRGSGFRIEPWATHVEIEFIMTAGQPLSSLWIDDFTAEFI